MLTKYLIGGLIAGLVYILAKKDGLERPKIMKTKIKLGFIHDFAVGFIAGFITIFAGAPEEMGRVIFLGIIGGYSGERVLKSYESSNPALKKKNLHEIGSREKKTLESKYEQSDDVSGNE